MTCPNCRARPLIPGRTLCRVCDPGPEPVDRNLAKRAEMPHSSWHFDPAFRRTVDGLKDKFIDDEYRPTPPGKKK